MDGRAFVFAGVRQPFEERRFPLPDVEPGGILVRVTVASICGSDVHGWRGQTPRSGPTIMGHEMTGRVERLGRDVKTDAAGAPLREGDRIVYSYFLPCGRCEPCLAHDQHHCVSRRIGAGRARSDAPPHFTGAYADYYYLRPGHYVLRTPDTLGDLTVAPLNCALAQVIYGLHQVGLVAGETLVVQGAGGLGLFAAAVARERGARQVVVLDRVPERLELATRFGADQVVNVDDFASSEDRARAVREMTGGGGHVVAELVGHPGVIAEGLAMSRVEGRYLVIGNIGSGFFQGQPVGGSVGQTALNRASGARTRWASILAGLWMLLILALLSGVVGLVAMPTLAALLIYAAAGSLRYMDISSIWRTGLTSQIAIAATFVATLLLPVAAAVGLGVVLSLLLQLNQSALDLKVVEIVPRDDGRYDERPAPSHLTSRAVTLIDVHGSLRYAGARTLQDHLPDPAGTESPAVVLRMRGRTTLGATLYTVLASYADQLSAVGGRLYISGLESELVEQAERNGTVTDGGPVRLYEASTVIGESSLDAYHDAQAWLTAQQPRPDERN
jgi:threonine dehydrogenase-like Zn-dependent dehydrogenase/anti-anti-sigma regulatory factor